MAELFFLASVSETKDCLTLARWHDLGFRDKPVSTSQKQNENQWHLKFPFTPEAILH